MADVAQLKIQIDASGVSTATKSLKDFEDQGGKTESAAEKLQGKIKDLVGAYLGFEGAKKALEFAKECVDAFIESENAAMHLTAAFRATGQESKTASEAISKYAEGLQKHTIYEKDATESAAAMLVQLSNLTEHGVKAALPHVMDLASAMGMDLNSAAELVAKAVDGNAGALSRYGVQIKSSKDPTEQFDNVMQALEQHFGGMADAMARTTGGQIQQFNNQIKEVKETIGGFIAKGFQGWWQNYVDGFNAIGEASKRLWLIWKDITNLRNPFPDLQALSTQELNDINSRVSDAARAYQAAHTYHGPVTNNTAAAAPLYTNPSGDSQAGYYQASYDDVTAYRLRTQAAAQAGTSSVTNATWEDVKKYNDELAKSQQILRAMNKDEQLLGTTTTTAMNAAAESTKLVDATFKDLGIQAATALAGGVSDLLISLGEAGAVDWTTAGTRLESFVAKALGQIGNMLIMAGLQLIVQGGPWEVGLALIAAGGIADIASGYISGLVQNQSSTSTTHNALGNVFQSGEVTPFAAGGIVSRPTLFPMARGGIGLMGEAGPEAILPLRRDSSGRLGVASDGEDRTLHAELVIDGAVLAKWTTKALRDRRILVDSRASI